MYTWGYIKSVSLAKLDLDEREADEQNLLSRFQFYANEAMTQICSIKPKHTFARFDVRNEIATWKELCKKYNVYSSYDSPITKPNGKLTDAENNFWTEFNSYYYTGKSVQMPEDFIAFGDDVNTVLHDNALRPCNDYDFVYNGYNNLMFFTEGIYNISYSARWFTLASLVDNNVLLNAPADVLDCIPSYIAHQCYKIDDETKSSIFRNEFEMFMARIDNTDYKQNKTFFIGGDW